MEMLERVIRTRPRTTRPRRAGSHLETGFLNLCRFAELPAPVTQHRFHPTRRWRFDFAWPDCKLAVEIDGGQFTHGRHLRPRGFQEDCEKLNAATLAGWRILRYTTRDLARRPVPLSEEVRAALVLLGAVAPRLRTPDALETAAAHR